MKKLIIAIIIFLSSIQIAYSQSGWFWQNPLPQGNTLRSVKFVDSFTGWAAGDAGTILKTTNGGLNWYSQSNLSVNMNSVFFVDNNTGWSIGDSGTVLATSNGGVNWNTQSSGVTNNLRSMYFMNSNTGWIAGYQGVVLKTTTGGLNWVILTDSASMNPHSMCFIDYTTGWIGIFKTTDGGNNWFPYSNGISAFIYSVHFIDVNTGWAAGYQGYYGQIYKTTNGGMNWFLQQHNDWYYSYFFSVYFADLNTGCAVGNFGIIFRTTNGGLNWYGAERQTENELRDVYLTDLNTGWTVGQAGVIIKTTDGGSNWNIQSSPDVMTHNLNSASFINSNTGWAIGNDGTVLKTTNSGINWIYYFTRAYNEIFSVHFLNTNTGYASGVLGHIWKSTNGGINWYHPGTGIIPTSADLYSIYFINPDTGWIVGSDDDIFKTTNGGQWWDSQPFGTTGWSLYSIYFMDDYTGWTVGSNGNILKTTNGGTNWETQVSGTNKNLYSLNFINNNTGWTVGSNGTILKTTNGGEKWSLQTSNTTLRLKTVYFIDVNTGWISGESGVFLQTTNSGVSWESEFSNTNNQINDIYFSNDSTGWLIGDAGTILKTTNTGVGSLHDFSAGPFIDFPEVFIKDSSYHIKARITNEGMEPETNVPIRFLLNGTQVGYYLRSLPAGGIDTVDFTWTTHTAGDFKVAITSALPMDINRSNDTVKADVRVYSSSALPIFCDDFSSGTANWTITNDGGTCIWQAYSPPYPNAYSLPATSSGAVLSADADECGSGTTILSTATIIENIDCSLFENVYLEFDNDWNAIDDQDSAIVEVSYDGGTSWSSVIAWGGADVRNTQESYAIPGADANPNVKIRFRSIQPGWDWWWAVDNVCIKGFPLTGLTQNSGEIPTKYALMQNYPNPFNPSTKIKFDLPKSTQAKLIIYDILGREIATLVNEKLNAGSYLIDWDGSSYPSGVYFYRLTTQDFSQTKRMILIK